MPAPKSTPAREKFHRTPPYFDVDRCARWKPPPDIGAGDRVELEKFPRLPKPRKSHDFGVIGTGAAYARDVLAPYMYFDRDIVKLEGESTTPNLGAMLENSVE